MKTYIMSNRPYIAFMLSLSILGALSTAGLHFLLTISLSAVAFLFVDALARPQQSRSDYLKSLDSSNLLPFIWIIVFIWCGSASNDTFRYSHDAFFLEQCITWIGGGVLLAATCRKSVVMPEHNASTIHYYVIYSLLFLFTLSAVFDGNEAVIFKGAHKDPALFYSLVLVTIVAIISISVISEKETTSNLAEPEGFGTSTLKDALINSSSERLIKYEQPIEYKYRES